MPKVNSAQTNFSSGEISPLLHGRIDINKYNNGAEYLSNFLPIPQGGIRRRSGSQYLGECEDTDYASKLIPFTYSTVQTYMLEFGNSVMRVWKDGVLLTSIDGAGGPTITTPYAYDELDEIYVAQSADVLFIAHPKYAPRELIRTLETDWDLNVSELYDGPYLDENSDEDNQVYLSVEATSASTITDVSGTTVTCSSAHGLLTGDTVVLSGMSGGGTDDGKYSTITYVNATEFTMDDAGTLTTIVGGSGTWTRHTYSAVATADFATTATAVAFAGTAADLDMLVDYLGDDEYWRLGKIIGWRSTTVCLIEPIDAVYDAHRRDNIQVHWGDKSDDDEIISSFAGAFDNDSIGRYVWGRYLGNAAAGVHWTLINQVSPGDGSRAVAVERTNSGFPILWGTEVVPDRNADDPIRISVSNFVRRGAIKADVGIFDSTDVGRFIRLRSENRVYNANLTNYVDDYNFLVTLPEMPPLSTDPPPSIPALISDYKTKRTADTWITPWRFGVWHAGTTNGTPNWPSVVAFHDQRLVFASTSGKPQTIWMSVVDDYTNFKPTESDTTVLDDNAITFTLAESVVNIIRWMRSGNVLLVGTSDSEWQVTGSTFKDPITPTSLRASSQTAWGSKENVKPVKLGPGLIYMQRTGHNVRELIYNFNIDGFDSQNLNIISEHIIRDNGTSGSDMAYQENPNSIFWLLLEDGNLASMTYERDQEVVAWARHGISGGTVKNIAVLQTESNAQDELWMVVQRTINSVTTRYIERLAPNYNHSYNTRDTEMKFMDAHGTFTSGSPTTAVTGMTHLIGETVQVVADGIDVTDDITNTVDGSGNLTLAANAETVHVGKNVSATVRTLPVEGGSSFGTSQGRRKRVAATYMRVLDSFDYSAQFMTAEYVGTGPKTFQVNPLDDSGLDLLYNGPLKVRLDHRSDNTDALLEISSNKAYPLNILLLSMDVQTNE